MDEIRAQEIGSALADHQIGLGVSAEEIRSELAKILASRTFRPARGQCKFLTYAVTESVAGRGHLLKEHLIGLEALGRGDTFDPRLDPIVRTQARKLRLRLAKYYQTEGADDPIRIEFRKGTYAPFFARVGDASPEALAEPSDVPPPPPEAAGQAIAPPPLTVKQPRPGAFRHRLRWIFASAACALIVAGSAAAYHWLSPHPAGAGPNESVSIAVLPFTNLGDDPQDEFLSDGLTEELRAALQQAPNVQVIGREFERFKSKNPDLRQIARELHVRTLLMGSVRKTGHRLHVSVQLNEAAGETHLWSGSYDRSLDEASVIPSEISSAVTNVLGVPLPSRNDPSSGRAAASPNPKAYEDYLKGLYFFNRLNAASLTTATEYFKRAIAEDPSFAHAYAALAQCYAAGPQVATIPPLEVVAKIKEAAGRALSLDNRLGEAHFDLAMAAEFEFNWAAADREYRTGLALNPKSVVGHLWYAKYLALVGRKPEVLIQRRMAAQLDPVSPYAIQAVGGYFSVMGQYPEAIQDFEAALALDPNFGLAHQGLGVAYALEGTCMKAIDELQLAEKLMPSPRRTALLGYAYGKCDRPAEARKILAAMLAEARQNSFPALAIAEVYLGLGDKDRAFVWLERAIDQRDLEVTLLWDSPFEPLRSDPRYAQLLRRMKLA